MSNVKIIATATLFLLTTQTSAIAGENFSINTPRGEESWFIYNNVQPGATITDAVVVKNPLNESARLAIYALDAEILKDGGFAPVEKEKRQRSIGAWLKLEENRVVIPSKKSKTISFSIRIPGNVTPARYIGVILATEAPPEQQENGRSYAANSNVGIQTRVGVRVYVNIAGATATQDNKNLAAIAEKQTRNTTQKTSTATGQRQRIISATMATTSTSTAAAQKDVYTFKKYLVQLGQLVIDHQRNTLWIIALVLLLFVLLAWRKKQ